jgi:hypothetical protein
MPAKAKLAYLFIVMAQAWNLHKEKGYVVQTNCHTSTGILNAVARN